MVIIDVFTCTTFIADKWRAFGHNDSIYLDLDQDVMSGDAKLLPGRECSFVDIQSTTQLGFLELLKDIAKNGKTFECF